MQLRKRVRDVDRLKEEGNQSFKSGVLNDAIEKYTAAIEVNHFHIEHEGPAVLNKGPILASREQG